MPCEPETTGRGFGPDGDDGHVRIVLVHREQRQHGVGRDAEGYYRNVNEDHCRHFEAMDVPLGTVGVVASARSEVLEGLAPASRGQPTPGPLPPAHNRDIRSIIDAIRTGAAD
jgi:hypothetical protein